MRFNPTWPGPFDPFQPDTVLTSNFAISKDILRLFPVVILFLRTENLCLCEQLDSLCSAVCLLIPWIFLEKSKMDAQGTWNFQPLILTLNSLCTFALNLSVFLVIQHTSALTIRVAGVVKDWVVVLLSALLFADTKLTLINIFGYAIGNDSHSRSLLYCFFLSFGIL